MSCLARAAFMPWFGSEDWEAIQNHTIENFTFIVYEDHDRKEQVLSGGERDKIRFGRLNKVTHEVMSTDPVSIIAMKSFLIATAGNLIFLTERVSFHVVKGAYLVIFKIVSALFAMAQDLAHFEIFKAIFTDFLDQLMCGVLIEVKERIVEIALAIFCYTGIEAAALFGVLFNPLKARKMIQLLERRVNHGDEFHHSEIELRKNFFAYICMQPNVYHFNPDNGHPRYKCLQLEDDPSKLQFGLKPIGFPDHCVPCPFLPCLC